MGTATQTARLNIHGVEVTDEDLPDFTTPIEPPQRILKLTDFPSVEPPQQEFQAKVERKQRKKTRALENAYLADQCLRLAKLVSEVNNGDAYFLAEEILGDLAVPEKQKQPVPPCSKPKVREPRLLAGEEAIRTRYEKLRKKYKPSKLLDEWMRKDEENYWAGLGAPGWEAAQEPRKFDAEFLDQRMKQHQDRKLLEERQAEMLERSERRKKRPYVPSPKERKEWTRRSVIVRATNRQAGQTPAEREEEIASWAEWLRVTALSPIDRSRENVVNGLRRAGWIV